MKANDFWTNFRDEIERNRTTLESVWDSRSDERGQGTPFTDEMKDVIDAAVKRTCPHLATQREYYRIDLIGWLQKNTEKKERYAIEDGIAGYHLNKHAWDFDIAVEHENDPSDWSDEVVKLAYICCDLRVVIGYFPYVKQGKEAMQQNYLTAVADTLQTLGCKDNMAHGTFMVILGDVLRGEAEDFKKLSYTPYIYRSDRNRFEPLTEDD